MSAFTYHRAEQLLGVETRLDLKVEVVESIVLSMPVALPGNGEPPPLEGRVGNNDGSPSAISRVARYE